jgi:hypothetical protein
VNSNFPNFIFDGNFWTLTFQTLFLTKKIWTLTFQTLFFMKNANSNFPNFVENWRLLTLTLELNFFSECDHKNHKMIITKSQITKILWFVILWSPSDILWSPSDVRYYYSEPKTNITLHRRAAAAAAAASTTTAAAERRHQHQQAAKSSSTTGDSGSQCKDRFNSRVPPRSHRDTNKAAEEHKAEQISNMKLMQAAAAALQQQRSVSTQHQHRGDSTVTNSSDQQRWQPWTTSWKNCKWRDWSKDESVCRWWVRSVVKYR